MRFPFDVIEKGICGQCQDEIVALTYGKPTITPKRYPNDWKEREKARKDEYDALKKECMGRVVVVATYFDDFASGWDGHVEHVLCECHLREALDALLQEND